MWGILERHENSWKGREIKNTKSVKKTVETYSLEQLSVLHKVEMWEEEAWTWTTFSLGASRCRRWCEGRFLQQLYVAAALPSAVVSQYTSVFVCPFLSYSRPSLQFITCLHSVSALRPAPDAMQGEHFEVLLICFFHVCFKNQKYCSFKYCALHRIFCHKLVNIYIFQYSDIYFHIYRTIKCFCSLFFLLFFRRLFFREIPENVCWQLPSFHKSERCDSLSS